MFFRALLSCVFLTFAFSSSATASQWDRYLAPEGRCGAGASAPEAPQVKQERAMRCLINFARTQKGLHPLKPSKTLAASAAWKAKRIVKCDDFSHTACGDSMRKPFDAVGYTKSGSWSIGENLVWNSNTASYDARAMMRLWLNSTGHRENILSPTWTEQGLALRDHANFQKGASAEIWVSHFGARG
jgi:uncharacterized protein YkwD